MSLPRELSCFLDHNRVLEINEVHQSVALPVDVRGNRLIYHPKMKRE